jgi:hypothetical protein
LYRAALFEVDQTKLPARLRKQRKRFALRARELFYAAGESIEEGQALDEAVRPACSAEHITKLTMVYRIAVRLPSRMLKNYS